jgi:hypothetical protein
MPGLQSHTVACADADPSANAIVAASAARTATVMRVFRSDRALADIALSLVLISIRDGSSVSKCPSAAARVRRILPAAGPVASDVAWCLHRSGLRRYD